MPESETQHCLTLKRHEWTEEMRAEALCSISHRLHSQPQKQAHQREIKIGGGHCDCAEAELYLDVSRADSDLRKINEGALHHTG